MINIAKALNTLYPNVAYSRGASIDDIKGYDVDNNEVPFDKNAVLQQAQRDDCKQTAKDKLAASDWSTLPDVQLANKADFENYRAILRGYVISPVINPTWPTEPQPIWN